MRAASCSAATRARTASAALRAAGSDAIIIGLTGVDPSAQHGESARAAGQDHVFAKPCNDEAVVHRVVARLHAARRGATPRQRFPKFRPFDGADGHADGHAVVHADGLAVDCLFSNKLGLK